MNNSESLELEGDPNGVILGGPQSGPDNHFFRKTQKRQIKYHLKPKHKMSTAAKKKEGGQAGGPTSPQPRTQGQGRPPHLHHALQVDPVALPAGAVAAVGFPLRLRCGDRL